MSLYWIGGVIFVVFVLLMFGAAWEDYRAFTRRD